MIYIAIEVELGLCYLFGILHPLLVWFSCLVCLVVHISEQSNLQEKHDGCEHPQHQVPKQS